MRWKLMRSVRCIAIAIVGVSLGSCGEPRLECGAEAVTGTLSSMVRDRVLRVAADGYPASYDADKRAALTKATRVTPRETKLVELALSSLAKAFKIAEAHLKRDLVSARAINWGNDPFARGAYSYVTLETRKIQSLLRSSSSDDVFFSGEAFYSGRDVGTVEAALASGLETARTLVAAR